MKPGLALAALTLAAVVPAQTHFSVTVVGKGRPVILIPGLSCGGNVWDATVARLKDRYECHVLTLAGFAGEKVVPGPVLVPVRDDIVAYVRAKHLDHPAVIGHSLGGFMAFSLASHAPALFGPIVAVDGVPWVAPLLNRAATSVDAVRPMAAALGKGMATQPPARFQASTLAALQSQITDPKEVARVDAAAKATDPATAGKAIEEMLVTDLRDEVAAIRSPVLLFAAGEGASSPAEKAEIERAYKAQVAKVPNVKIVYAWKSKHFVMLDEPTLFLAETERFLKANGM